MIPCYSNSGLYYSVIIKRLFVCLLSETLHATLIKNSKRDFQTVEMVQSWKNGPKDKRTEVKKLDNEFLMDKIEIG